MKEHIKTAVLILLVSTSLYFSYTLWTSFPQKSFFMTKSTPVSVDISDILRPSSIIVESSGTFMDVTSSNDINSVWMNTVKILKEIKNTTLLQLSKNDLNRKGDFVHIYFGKGITEDLFKNALKLNDSPILKIGQDTLIKEIIIKLGVKPQIIFTDYSSYYAIDLKNSSYFLSLISKQFQSSINYSITTAGDVYSENKFAVKSFPLKRYVSRGFENDTVYRTITKNVFVNISVVREIKENSGSYIYTDGVRGLRLYQNGLIEYFDTTTTSSKLTLGRVESLDKAVEFIKTLGIDEKNVYLTGVSGSGGDYSFAFNYDYDYPMYVLRNGDIKDPIYVFVSNGTIKSAIVNYMNIYYAGQYNGGFYDIGKLLKDHKIDDVQFVDMVYVFDGNELIPAWHVKTQANEYFFSALDGKIM
ncbi:YycH family protein [Thermoanaerobacterium xylanolyticum LX-11]|uniref:YycH family protein n=1 Tax=Thermoanaerobacterium xylanolyticum (strain ATCC 49914 / DSM 7097 / LX-11) TaxID=858215 RepID=F6BFM9_THEXL|nr:two-component system activity regulator YycH [Thermoanaerobacterium xylanolyticum]AEF18333.1 YycH family protein [Thermoanaerobacterium xylanolyticum LX-11]